jgi:hypothetical protein
MRAIETIAENISDVEVYRWDVFSLALMRGSRRYGAIDYARCR